ncbi:plasmid mobilization relaxosome protein MobC [Salipiger sp. IMCC34102]|uniref:plasmid mobilization relaxosome protein MobC n=1 Tax=Salipiger sp. IMCC34102 TaxID=2510647 RepID=UPI0013EB22A3|nr:plasmid mobilization relaxosome protein MobC [Salipiger sp. IMCC34102]
MIYRLTPGEVAVLRKAAADTGRAGLNDWARAVALEAAGRPEMSRPVLVRIVGELGRIGVNINQIARHANTHRKVGLEEELKRNLHLMEDAMAQITDALG